MGAMMNRMHMSFCIFARVVFGGCAISIDIHSESFDIRFIIAFNFRRGKVVVIIEVVVAVDWGRLVRLRYTEILVITGHADQTPVVGDRDAFSVTTVRPEERVLGLIVSFQPMQEGKQGRVRGVCEQVAEVDLGELGS
jgi:hypothetical protein